MRPRDRIGSLRPRCSGVAVRVLVLTLLIPTSHAALGQSEPSGRIEKLNRDFLEHIVSRRVLQPQEVEFVEKSWREEYSRNSPETFVPDALAVLYPSFREILAAFDDGRYADVAGLTAPLLNDADPYLAANAHYYAARSLVERGMLEEAEVALADVATDDAKVTGYTPYAAQLWFMKGYCQAANLHFEEALKTLRKTNESFPDAPEAVAVGLKQLLLELERREIGTLDEVAGLMGYSAARLKVADAARRVRQRQQEVLDMLDKLIEQQQQQEKSQGGKGGKSGKGGGKGRKGPASGAPSAPAEESVAPDGGSKSVDLHGAPKAAPGEMWGKLPPAEREKILQSLRDRFPSRYRQLVEQYYRSLAEESR